MTTSTRSTRNQVVRAEIVLACTDVGVAEATGRLSDQRCSAPKGATPLVLWLRRGPFECYQILLVSRLPL